MSKRRLVSPPNDFHDPSTYSNPNIYFTRHLSLELDINPFQKVIKGIVTIEAEILQVEQDPYLVLDTRGLQITQVQDPKTGKNYSYQIEHGKLGSALKVSLRGFSFPDQTVRVRISYTTQGEGEGHPVGGACGWLTPEQTAGGKLPYLFTQSQTIHARSIFPCQDTPSAKTPFTATISVPVEFRAIMSGILIEERRKQVRNDGSTYNLFIFEQTIPVASYLISIAVGELESQELSERCRVWTEPAMVEAACFEFGQTEQFVKAVESVCGAYVWSRYDILCLPPSFPFGAMENPCLTFLTPTLLAGDRSLASVIVHEIVHCWSGNLVTCCNWQDFWLNEGISLFLSRKITSKIRHKDSKLKGSLESFFGLETYLGRVALKQALESLGKGHPYTRLVPDLSDGVDPDDAFGPSPYEKGFNLLLKLERLTGEDKFLRFLRSFFERFQFQSVSTANFIAYFSEYFTANISKPEFDSFGRLVFKGFDWDEWLYSTGDPPEYPEVDLSLVYAAQSLAKLCIETEAKSLTAYEVEGWDSSQMIVFLDSLLSQGNCSQELVKRLDLQLRLNHGPKGKNAEIRLLWLKLALRAHYEPAVENAIEFVTTQGRMKYIRPIYRELHSEFPKGSLAVNTFTKNRKKYHNIASKLLAKDFGLD
ncbi:hypothetical protein GpartN1_g258.t1 [Galdieria partita]|uniref:Peptidase M1 leukotriene A4 hydrolase/aminopeptidase C-terminal domain-containing protein n=1 Tax=Galdieria partita TaxID=83374 RepID=A0A9C7UMC9_9RHOD|nr:hypothetical protein GpartN1_g258.t1 [Galdieria partita]